MNSWEHENVLCTGECSQVQVCGKHTGILVERTKCLYQRTGKTTVNKIIPKYSLPDFSVQHASDVYWPAINNFGHMICNGDSDHRKQNLSIFSYHWSTMDGVGEL